MIADILLLIGTLILKIITAIFAAAAQFFNLPLQQIQDGFAYWIAPAYYFQGVMPVDTMLQILGLTIGFTATIFFINIMEWLWHKIPFIGH